VGACVDWIGGVSEGGARVSVQASVSRNLINLSASRIPRLKVGGFLVGTISHSEVGTPPANVPRDIVNITAANVGALNFATGIRVFDGELQNLNVAGTPAAGGNPFVPGNLLAGVTCFNTASVGTITVTGVYVGSMSTNSGNVGLIDVRQHLGGSITTTNGNITEVRVGTSTFLGTLGVALDANGMLRPANATISAGGSANIGSISATGDILGTITAGGRITTEVRANGAIAAVNAAGQFEFGLIRANGGNIALVATGTDLIADIQTPAGALTTATIGRDLFSNITSRDSCDRIDVIRDSYGNILLSKGLSATGQIHVGRTLQTAGRITLNSSSAFTGGVGLAGQVILNSNNLSGAFSGQVRIPQGGGTPDTVISQAAYPATVASLGGGSVGVVSYIRHDADCSPVSNGVRLLPVFFAPSPIRVAFYGPVLDSSLGGAAPVKIEWDMNGMWLPVDQFFSVSLSGRQVVIAPASGTTQTSIPAGRFRVTPRNAELICGGLTVTPPPISFEYFFRLFPDCNGNSIADPDDFISGFSQDCNHNGVPDSCDISSGASVDANSDGIPDECSGVNCPADFNGDRVLDPDDLADYIGCYFGTPQCSGADFYGDGVVDPDDLADFITAFFAGC